MTVAPRGHRERCPSTGRPAPAEEPAPGCRLRGDWSGAEPDRRRSGRSCPRRCAGHACPGRTGQPNPGVPDPLVGIPSHSQPLAVGRRVDAGPTPSISVTAPGQDRPRQPMPTGRGDLARAAAWPPARRTVDASPPAMASASTTAAAPLAHPGRKRTHRQDSQDHRSEPSGRPDAGLDQLRGYGAAGQRHLQHHRWSRRCQRHSRLRR